MIYKKPTALVILDGFGYSNNVQANAIAQSNLMGMQRLRLRLVSLRREPVPSMSWTWQAMYGNGVRIGMMRIWMPA